MKGPVILMHLVPLSTGAPIALDKPIMFFGRQPECDVVLLNSRKVSRKHCCIAQIDDHFVVRDLGSMNGVRVNGKPVHIECHIAPGDEVMIGDIPFRVEIRAQEKKSPPPPPVRGPEKPNVKGAPAKPAAKAARRVDPKFLSQDLPVVLPDEVEVDFAIEETQRKMVSKPAGKTFQPAKKKPVEENVIELDDLDIIED